jgi:DNA (cytosine-5)-methyltransferase 1
MKCYTEVRFFKWKEDEVAVSLRNRSGSYGGGSEVLVVQRVTGTLSPGAHPGSYNGQDAYNDLLVCGKRADAPNASAKQSRNYQCNARSTDNYEGGV